MNTSTKIIAGAAAALFLASSAKGSSSSDSQNYTSVLGGNGFPITGGTPGTDTESFLGCSCPRGVRNNNPGNIKFFTSNDWRGKVPESQNTDTKSLVTLKPTFEQFISFAYGVRALIKIIKVSYIPSGRNTLNSIINSFAPDGGSPYLNYLVSKVGIPANQVISENDDTKIKKIVQAIARFENGRTTQAQEVITDNQYYLAKSLL